MPYGRYASDTSTANSRVGKRLNTVYLKTSADTTPETTPMAMDAAEMTTKD